MLGEVPLYWHLTAVVLVPDSSVVCSSFPLLLLVLLHPDDPPPNAPPSMPFSSATHVLNREDRPGAHELDLAELAAAQALSTLPKHY